MLKLVQKGSGKRTHVTIEQEAGSGVEPSPNVEYTFEMVDNGDNSVDIRSFKRVDGGAEQTVGWSIGSVSGDGADLVTINKRDGGVDILIGNNTSENRKSWSVTLMQEESGKTIELGGGIYGKEYVFRKDREAGVVQPNEKNFKYVITSTCNGSFIDYKMAISGEGKEYIKCVFLDKIHQEVAENSDKKHYLYIQHLENKTGKDLPYVISLTQNESGKELVIERVVKSAISPDPDPDVKVMPEVWKEIVGVAPKYTLRLRWSNYDEMKSYSGNQLNVNLMISTPTNPYTTGGTSKMETTNRKVVLVRDNILEMPINSSYGKPEVIALPIYNEGGNPYTD